MDTPLFGEETPRDKAVQYIVGGLLTIGALLTLVFSFINGAKNPVNIVLGITILGVLAVVIVLWRWYRVGDLDPKFKYLIGGVIALLIIFIVVSNIYFWAPTIDDICNDGLYDVATGECYPYSARCGVYDCYYFLERRCQPNCTGQDPPPTTVPTEPAPTRSALF